MGNNNLNTSPFTCLANQCFPEESIEFSFLFNNSQLKKFIFGKNQYTKYVISIFNVSGIIDEHTNETTFEGIPIYSNLSKVESSSLILVCSLVNRKKIMNRLRNLNIKCLDYLSFLKLNPSLPLKDHVFNDKFQEFYNDSMNNFIELFNLLHDQTSKNTFKKIVNYRLTYIPKFLDQIKSNNKQYWENFLRLPCPQTFIDVGCFNGDNSIEFIEKFPNYSSVYAFEPIYTNFVNCKKAMQKFKNVTTYQIALGANHETLIFSESACASKQDPNGNLHVESKPLDSILNKIPVSYIKIDAEGDELCIIKGMKNTISNSHPNLAICVYHKPSDFITIPKEVLSINGNYKLYLRHYSDSINETVLYFIPH
jgi:FkbM family methyltransferase